MVLVGLQLNYQQLQKKLANKIIKFFIFIIDAFITNYSNYSISLNATINVG